MRSAIRLLIAALAALLSLMSTSAVTHGLPTRTTLVHDYAYGVPHHDEPNAYTASERGPPAITYDQIAPMVADAHRSSGVSARPESWSTDAHTTYGSVVQLAQVDRASVATEDAAQGAWAGIVSLVDGRVAANTLAKACSFTGATAVLMADGTKKPIEEIEIGDEVIATDPETGEQVAKKVEHVFVHEDTVTDLVIDGQVISTTEDHPFWSATDQRFERADQLAEGEKVLGADGRVLTVSGLELGTTRTTTAYNLSVEGIHTYHVGGAEILVHNNCINWAANSVKTFGHTFNTHGAGPKNLRSLTDRARGTGEAQGQWLDNAAAADFLSNAHVSGAGPYSVRLPEGLGQVIMPDGSIVQARAATIVPNPNGVIRTAFPILGGP